MCLSHTDMSKRVVVKLKNDDSLFNKLVTGILDEDHVKYLIFCELLLHLRSVLEEFVVRVFNNIQEYF